jgi:hypothetical protein
MSNVAAVVLLFCCSATLAPASCRAAGAVDEQGNTSNNSAQGIKLFDLHDPELMSEWPDFLATTPMLNDELLPSSLQDRLTNLVATYRSLTPVDRPAFFVATYFDVLSERLLAVDADEEDKILPLQVCPVFVSGNDASVSSLLAMASGLPEELFVNAPGEPEHYRYLFLQTEFSHCRFLATIKAGEATRQPMPADRHAGAAAVSFPFSVDLRSYIAVLGNKEELRALVETVGEVDAIAKFRQQVSPQPARDEAEVLSFVRLVSLLATDGRSGYAAIPVLYPMLSESADEERTAESESLRIADALDLAYRARDVFRQIVPFGIRDTDELLSAKLTVMKALAEGSDIPDDRIASLLEQFVTGADLLLATTLAQEKMPLIGD